MKLSDFIAKKLKPNLNNTAFFLGNGINLFSNTSNSWTDLLINLAQTHIGQRDDKDYAKLLKDNSVTYPEFFDLIQLSSDSKDQTFDYKSIKKGFKQNFEKWKPTYVHTRWTNTLMRLNRPILTTNYDYLLEFSNDQIKNFMRSQQYNKKFFRPIKSIKKRESDVYPWHYYYSSKKIKDANKEFAIWHIHGFYEYSRSIRLGLADYMGMVEKSRRWLRKSPGNPFFKYNQINNWPGKISWLDVFIHNHLLFVGLSLDAHETGLRWLLLEREKLFKMHPELRKETWYLLTQKDLKKLPKGKRLFFEQLGIKLVVADTYTEIYSLPTKL